MLNGINKKFMNRNTQLKLQISEIKGKNPSRNTHILCTGTVYLQRRDPLLSMNFSANMIRKVSDIMFSSFEWIFFFDPRFLYTTNMNHMQTYSYMLGYIYSQLKNKILKEIFNYNEILLYIHQKG